ncbi:phosphatidylinositol-specific phospholipase C [Yersinia mollaretii]|uniref:phosphatidylinositol-specific phospholipase C n=1 Tax=Yersinia mollaretii TaxID=33060 RepID=UPI0005DB9A34|nr:phosphatidylinositol-specific phospholipase C [Yersinia mollaretii]PJE86070.1 phosphatidylinositol diacylglycerol-lyase [Yersinia mollaretii]CQD42573.1 phosphatidylinositol diacylglycerol-lyase [Yersinia mollaretii]CQH38197.1 phosphatidylinositol diacylglycerol-lyase [Yersinia mollaretii]
MIRTTNNWVGLVDESKFLSELSIPGTHDSAAYTHHPISFGYVQTQRWNIREQLDSGIRFLDIRCRLIENVFTLHHGSVYLGLNFGDVLASCIKFLLDNPTEFIILSVKKEHTEKDSTMPFHKVMSERYIKNHNNLFFTENKIPTIKEIIGKIVLFRRYHGGDLGINAAQWRDNNTFTIKNRNYNIHIQDKYSGYNLLDFDKKREHVAKLIKRGRNGKKNELYINFTNVSDITVTPLLGAVGNIFRDGLNEWFTDEYKTCTTCQLGIVVSDFVDTNNAAMINVILKSNTDFY